MGYRFFKLDDNNLMELYQNGDEKAFDVLYSRSKKRVYSYLKKGFMIRILSKMFIKIFL